MTKVKTTITLPATLLKQAKHRAVEFDLNLSQLMEKALNLILFDAQVKHLIEKERERIEQEQLKKDLALIDKLAGGLSLDMNLSPKQLKKLIMRQYDEEMLS